MRILVVGATGTIGSAIVDALRAEHEIVEVSRGHTPLTADISDPASIRAMYAAAGRVDAVISAAGAARRKTLTELTDEDFDFCLRNKLMGQVNLVRYGLEHVNDNGSFTLTSGILSRQPIPGSEAISLVNAGLEAFARAAALEMPRGLRVNVVSPPWVTETLQALGMTDMPGLPAAVVARAYVEAVTGTGNGAVIEP
jgi:NAD(P)-dependent dehydrogenase (short-subunit alcohol dehydrogenase family)